MLKSNLSYLFVLIPLYSLLLSSTNSEILNLISVKSINEVIMGDGVNHSLGTKCEGSFMGGFYATILLNGAVSSPQEEATIVFTSTSDTTKIV